MEVTNIKKELTIYFIITIVISWFMWMPSIISSQGIKVHPIFLIISMMASFTPSIVGLILQRKYLGKIDFRKNMKRRLSLKFSKWWLFLIPIYFFTIGIISYGILKLVDSDFVAVGTIPIIMTPLVFLQILFIGGALGEEFGWRGFALERLLKLYSPLIATLILGIIWSFWHLPLFFMEGTAQSNMPMWQFMLQNTIFAFYYTWVYLKSKENLWLMIYLHAISNTVSAVLPYWQSNAGRYIGFVVLVIGLMLIAVLDYGKRNSLKQKK